MESLWDWFKEHKETIKKGATTIALTIGVASATVLVSSKFRLPEVGYSEFIDSVKQQNVKAVVSLPGTSNRINFAKATSDGKLKWFSTMLVFNSAATMGHFLTENGVPYRATSTSLKQLIVPYAVLFASLGAAAFIVKTLLGDGHSVGTRRDKKSRDAPSITFGDVAGVTDAKMDLQEIVDYLQNPTRYRTIGAHLPRGVLLIGPSGTGKTLLAKAVAGEAQVPFFACSASEFVEEFVGRGAGRVRELFQRAKVAAPSIIFIDEIDSLGQMRTTRGGSYSNEEREQTLNQLLTAMDGFDSHAGVVVIAATNRYQVLDEALLRPGRFDRHVKVDLPSEEDRKEILMIHLRHVKVAEGVEWDYIAARTQGFSGAELANLINEAAFMAVRSKRPVVEKTDFAEALQRSLTRRRLAIQSRNGLMEQHSS
eukprot:GILK01006332.1.p1 GENE.GILK01006332.1~~GILK01006332.1.p1  ORF type:complete len:438 (+),score=66.15 GILK01006332.1:41-1315(+)